MSERLSEKATIVTGASAGIGKAVAERFADEGASVAIADIDTDGLSEVADGIDGETLTIETDVSDPDAVEEMVERTVSEFGKLDVLVNNAGVGTFGTVTDLTDEEWDRTIGVDLNSVFYGARAAISHLSETNGCIINTASISGNYGDYGLEAYNAAKGGVKNLTKTMAINHGPEVRVNSVSPGFVETDATAAFQESEAIMDRYDEVIPLERPGEPADIAAGMAFLASDDASYLNGHDLVIDGGLTAATGQPKFSEHLDI